MSKHRISNLTQELRAAAAILIVLSLGLFYPGTVSSLHAQSPAKAKASSPAGGPKEGIKVHGRWTIDIRNPDGKLVAHHKFENALTTFGASYLGKFLQRTLKPGEWAIRLSSTNASLDSCNKVAYPNIVPGPCVIYETDSQVGEANGGFGSKSLTITSQGGNTENTVLAGTVTARRDGVIDSVATLLSGCPVDTPGICSASSPQGSFYGVTFTQTPLPNPINVVAGQIIQVTVVISFS